MDRGLPPLGGLLTPCQVVPGHGTRRRRGPRSAAKGFGLVGHNGAVREDDDTELLERVRALRAAGSGPKQVARALGLRPGQTGVLVRRAAAADQAVKAGDRPVVGCWVSPGWSSGLDLSACPGWAAQDPSASEEATGAGFAQVLVARRERASRVRVTGVLVDVYCLGVKNVIEPRTMTTARSRNPPCRSASSRPRPSSTGPSPTPTSSGSSRPPASHKPPMCWGNQPARYRRSASGTRGCLSIS